MQITGIYINNTTILKRDKRKVEEGNGHPLQCFCLENLMDRGDWRNVAHRVTKSRTRLSTQREM